LVFKITCGTENRPESLRTIPGLERAEFLQFGQIHRNTYLNSPRVLAATMQMREHPNIFFAGQITGVEGYVESVAMGWLAGQNGVRLLGTMSFWWRRPAARSELWPRLCFDHRNEELQPVNITFALLKPLTSEQARSVKRKRDRHSLQVRLALEEWDAWLQRSERKTSLSWWRPQERSPQRYSLRSGRPGPGRCVVVV
jgi:methylenetetrahydrofolate--tRNA-(uracil-5-)-methyltransferase